MLVFGAGFGDTLESGIGVGELEVGPGDVRFFDEELLQRRNGRFEIILVDIALSFVEEVVERVGEFLFLGLDG